MLGLVRKPPYDYIETAELQADTVRALIRRPIDDVAQIVNKNADTSCFSARK